MTRKIYYDQTQQKEIRTIKQRDKIVIGILLAIVGVILFSMICNYAKTDPWVESKVVSENSGVMTDE
ncbi:MAG: hypothetical protein K6B69_16515 [Lachnospiraceae bacterium]|nr:hypothetical protein [Lachnospiraceae bacterium]